MIAVERGRRIGYMEGQAEYKNMRFGKNFQAPTKARLTRQYWHIKTEDALYFRYNVPSHLLKGLVETAFRLWGMEQDPVTTAQRIMDCYVGGSRRNGDPEAEAEIQAQGPQEET